MNKTILNFVKKMRTIPGLDWIILGLGLIVFVVLGFHMISASSIWFDEAFSAYIAQFNLLDIARYTATDVHPPLYYWLLKGWTELFGTTELALRSMSLFFGATSVSVGFMLVRRLFGRRAAWVSLLFLVLSPMLIRYSQEARMYTLATTIALSATYVLVRAMQSKRRSLWVLYGVLVSLGMWTHYFTALVWLAHWAWWAIVVAQTGARGKQFMSEFFTKNWIIAHVVAVGLFLPWLPAMFIQLTGIQKTGFWIGPVTADSLTGYVTNVLFYQNHDYATGWYAVALAIIVAALTVLAFKLYRTLTKQQRQYYLLIAVVAFVPVLLLFAASLPPLASSFVERYLVPAAAAFSLFAGITLALGMEKLKTGWRVAIIALVAVSMMFGISNVYYYGNFNKSSNINVSSGELVKEIQARAQPGEPIIAATPWIFYEAVFYTSANHPVYFIDANTEYVYGSLDMLKDNDQHKIKNLDAFAKEHPVVWYINYSPDGPVISPDSTWKQTQSFSIYDQITKQDPYKAIQLQTR